jgi:hypothetical protein
MPAMPGLRLCVQAYGCTGRTAVRSVDCCRLRPRCCDAAAARAHVHGPACCCWLQSLVQCLDWTSDKSGPPASDRVFQVQEIGSLLVP